jgi:serine protease AprX
MDGQLDPNQPDDDYICCFGAAMARMEPALVRRKAAMANKSVPRRRHSLPPGKPMGIDDQGNLEEATLRRFVFQTFGRARRTQDSPVMPDVWLRYIRVAEKIAVATIDRSKAPTDLVDLLLTPWSGVRPGQIAKRLRDRLKPSSAAKPLPSRRHSRLAAARIALSDSRVVACANFETLVRDVVPLSGWWQQLFQKKKEIESGPTTQTERFDDVFKGIVRYVRETRRPAPPGSDIELSRYAALVGFIALLQEAGSRSAIRNLAELAHQLGPATGDTEVEIEDQRRDLNEKEVALLLRAYERAEHLLRPSDGWNDVDTKGVYLISLNRSAAQSLFESRATIKADAAHRVFNINATGIVFAVIDGGIDATHPAFLKRSDDQVKKLITDKVSPSAEECLTYSRVQQTYDFTLVRDIVAQAGSPEQLEEPNRGAIKFLLKDKKHKRALNHLRIRGDNARDLDWEIIKPLIQIPHKMTKGNESNNGYRVPGTDHGTHVAGILAANLPEDPDSGRELKGMCPELSLFDLRVFDADGRGDEFAILCAIEFVGWLNRDRANPVVHGVNLSLALAHDVDSFACGQTPICEACNHLVGAGTVVVVAAGNTGFEGGAQRQSLGTGYRAISITDPGNADNVITVGSTHRRDPHLYGVSYFSARGPTGDGRRKPDILAPGEKITSTIRDGHSQRMDGTSMAAPHVAGAAALLMARYPELIGRPLRIKEILMQTATDLNREANFQGAGLVDVLRALQSV